jgi:hypothetical protein
LTVLNRPSALKGRCFVTAKDQKDQSKVNDGLPFLSKVATIIETLLGGKVTLPAFRLMFSAPLSGGRSWQGVKTFEVHAPTKVVKLDADGYVHKEGTEHTVKVDDQDRYTVLLHFARYRDAAERTAALAGQAEARSTADVVMDALHAVIRSAAHNANNRRGNVTQNTKTAQTAYTAAGFTAVTDADTGRLKAWEPNAGLVAEVNLAAGKIGPIPSEVLLDVTGYPRMQLASMALARCEQADDQGCKVGLRVTIAQLRDGAITIDGARCNVHKAPIVWDDDAQAIVDEANRKNSKRGRPAKAKGKGAADAQAVA